MVVVRNVIIILNEIQRCLSLSLLSLSLSLSLSLFVSLNASHVHDIFARIDQQSGHQSQVQDC
jgi:hypothetical protein